jgi:hypothetical protein
MNRAFYYCLTMATVIGVLTVQAEEPRIARESNEL